MINAVSRKGMMRFDASVKLDTQKLNKLMILTNAEPLSRIVRTSVHHVLIPRIYDYIRDENAVDTGFLMKSIATRIVDRGLGKTVAVEVGTFGADYGLPVEKGSKPHWPNIDNLRGWVRRKLKVPVPEVAGVTFLIARSIAAKGTKAHPYMLPAYFAEEDRLFYDINRRIEALIF